MVKGENPFLHAVLWPPQVLQSMHSPSLTKHYTLNAYINTHTSSISFTLYKAPSGKIYIIYRRKHWRLCSHGNIVNLWNWSTNQAILTHLICTEKLQSLELKCLALVCVKYVDHFTKLAFPSYINLNLKRNTMNTMVHTNNPNTWQIQAGGSEVQSQPELHETWSKNQTRDPLLADYTDNLTSP